jgi:hypothetical protein
VDYDLTNIVIGGSVVVGSTGFWRGGASGSVGIHTRGRQSLRVINYTAFADKPIQLSVNPNGATEISGDHYNFHNLFIGATEFACVTIDTGTAITQLSFTGHQAWVLGEGGLRWVDTTSTGVSNGLFLQNVRYENNTNTDAYFVHIEHNTNLQDLLVIGGQAGVTPGFFLRKVQKPTFVNFWYTDTSREAMNVDSTVNPIVTQNCLWNTGSTANIQGLTLDQKMTTTTSGPVAETGFYSATSDTAIITQNITVGGDIKTLAVDEIISIGGSTQMGFLLIQSRTTNTGAIYTLNGSAGTTTEISDPGNDFDNAIDTATSYNIYWSAANSAYELQNKTAACADFRLTKFGFV